MQRRRFIKGLALGTSVSLLATKSYAKGVTPNEIEGPFYPITPQQDKDADLTKVAGKSGIAKGEIIEVFGQIFDQNNQPVEGVTLDLWQANSFGKYHHPHDNSDNPVDEHFQSWAILQSGREGRYRFKTVMPGAYPLPGGKVQRTPHIHFKIAKNGYESLLTQMYFPGQSLNDTDPLIARKSAEETALMTAKIVEGKNSNHPEYQWDVIIAKL